MSAESQLLEQVRGAIASKRPLRIGGSGGKDFLAQSLEGEMLDMRKLDGIVSYEPAELVITALAGTPLAEIEAVLAAQGQMLAFEPPHFGPTATIGGCVASGLAGPRRATAGAVRDFVLGVRIIDGHGEAMRFGGQVMKNVAGFDVSRLMVGAWGTLGVLLEASVKTLPLPPCERTLSLAMDATTALRRMNELAGRPLPISASLWHDGVLSLRLSGADQAVRVAQLSIGGEVLADAAAKALWQSLREQTHSFFDAERPLWRLSLPSTAAFDDVVGAQIIEWGGAQRWLHTDMLATDLRAAVVRLGGHATAWCRRPLGVPVFHTLSPAVLALHKRLKQTFDPLGIFNPGRMTAEY